MKVFTESLSCQSLSGPVTRRCRTGTAPLEVARRGISLFEVVLALAIFVGAFAAISQVLRLGSRASIRAQLQTEAVLRCDRRMNEVLAGILPLESVSGTAFEDNQSWRWTMDVTESSVPNLLRVELLVEHTATGLDANAQHHLVRLVRDPQVYIDAATATATTSEVF